MHVNTFVITFYNIFLIDLFLILTDIIMNPPQQHLYSKKSGFSTASCCIDKTKSMYIIYACKNIRYNLL